MRVNKFFIWIAGIFLLLPAAFRPANQGYRFPISAPELLLSGTFGELRSDHFHSGIDIKTGGVTGMPVMAVRDGYVYRIKVSPTGYGKAVYLRHDDGNFSVYAHLDHFNPEIEEYLFQKQYATKKYEQELYLSSDRIPLRTGSIVGYSGNTGSSLAPHLHFEIRDGDENVLNPLLYYRDKVSDIIPPVLQSVAFEALTAESRVNGRFGKQTFQPEGGNGNYRLSEVIQVTGPVGLEYVTYDLLTGAPNPCGVNFARLTVDNEVIFEFSLDKFSFEDKKYINVHVDYAELQRTGNRFQRCYLEDGNQLECYEYSQTKGKIILQDYEQHALRLELRDAYGNATTLYAKIKKQAVSVELPPVIAMSGIPAMSYEWKRNTLLIKMMNPNDKHREGLDIYFADGSSQRILPAQYQNNELLFLYEADPENTPIEVKDPLSGRKLSFAFQRTAYPDKNNLVELENVQVFFPHGSLFDTLHAEIKKVAGMETSWSPVYEIGQENIPLKTPFVINFHPVSTASNQYLIVVNRQKDGSWKYCGGERKSDGSIAGTSATFGTFTLMADSVPPIIRPSNFVDGGVSNGQNLRLTLTDNFSGIDSDRIMVTLDGSWVLVDHDAKTNSITLRLKQKPEPGKHIIETMVYDLAGNLASNKYSIQF